MKYFINKVRIIIILAVSLTATAICPAATYYVSPEGSDENYLLVSGYQFRTIQAAANAVNPGDIVFVRQGVYHEELNLIRPGSEINSVAIMAYPNEKPVIDGSQPVGSWSQYSGHIYKASVAYTVKQVIVDNTILAQVGSIGAMGDTSFYQAGNLLYVWCPDGGTPANRTVGVLKGMQKGGVPPLVSITGDGITFSGFTVRFGSGKGINVTGDNTRVENCEVKFVMQHGILADNVWNCVISANTVYETCLMNWPRSNANTWPGGIGYLSGGNGSVTRNTVFRNHGEGIGTLGGQGNPGVDGLEIKDNIVFDNWSVNIWIDHGSNVVIDGNYAYVTDGKPAPGLSNSTPAGILCAEESGFGDPGDLHDVVVVNNLVSGCSSGFGFWFDASGSGLKNFTIANNTFVNNVNAGVSVDSGNHSNSTFRNNIIYQTQGLVLDISTPNDTVFDHNCWFHQTDSRVFMWAGNRYSFSQWQTATGRGSASLFQNPAFTAGDALPVPSYRIAASSPCLDAGLSIPAAAADFWHTSRPQGPGYDLGFYEHQANSDLPGVTTNPAADIEWTSATLSGLVDSKGRKTIYWVEYGLASQSYESSALYITYGATAVSMTLAGLTPSARYTYRVVAENGSGTQYGTNQTFQTLESSSGATGGGGSGGGGGGGCFITSLMFKS